MRTYKVFANWDAEAGVWVATSEDVVGLVTEADTLDALMAKLKVLVPELIEENGSEPSLFGEFPVSLEIPVLPPRPGKVRAGAH